MHERAMGLRWLAPLLLPSLVVALRPRIVMLRVSDPTDRDQNFGEGDQLAVNILPYLGNDVYVFESKRIRRPSQPFMNKSAIDSLFRFTSQGTASFSLGADYVGTWAPLTSFMEALFITIVNASGASVAALDADGKIIRQGA